MTTTAHRRLLHEQLRRVNVLAASMLVAVTFAGSGSLLLYKGLGGTSKKVAVKLFGSGLEIESGSAGVTLCFASLLITATALTCDRKKRHDISVKLGDREIKWSGTLTTIEELDAVDALLKLYFQDARDSNKAPAPAASAAISPTKQP